MNIQKTDNESGKPLANAEYEIYAKEDIVTPEGIVKHTAGELLDTVTTTENGFAESKELYLGAYMVREKTAPEGYVLDETEYEVILTYGNPTASVVYSNLNITNTNQKGVIQISKTDNESGKPLSNAEYEIYVKEDIVTPEGTVKHTAGELLDTVTTNDNGFAKSKELYLGTYTVKEKTAPEGYILNRTEFDVTLTYGNQTEQVIVTSMETTNANQKGRIKGIKTGEVLTGNTSYSTDFGAAYSPSYEMQPLAGAIYDIYAKYDIITPEGTVKYTADQLIETVSTNKNGEFLSDDLYLKHLYCERRNKHLKAMYKIQPNMK
ncbi:MAG: collagen binding domain-containing protein [Eubacteriales bacterium]